MIVVIKLTFMASRAQRHVRGLIAEKLPEVQSMIAGSGLATRDRMHTARDAP
jgi:hypothetical protein